MPMPMPMPMPMTAMGNALPGIAQADDHRPGILLDEGVVQSTIVVRGVRYASDEFVDRLGRVQRSAGEGEELVDENQAGRSLGRVGEPGGAIWEAGGETARESLVTNISDGQCCE